ncbi:hypothetical protein B879_00142 [Cecembia lonarensis LW9]|uniref:DUF3307 domain-containing protein n=2 Tax=Cecembia TaxID=1187078 RepID=K1LLR8_CECL9|nr:hypothetical protein B879_00142 [Cecembia lonarensis LW9]
MLIMIKLFLAHLIGDFVLQPSSWVEEKKAKKIKSGKLYLHILIHGVLVLVLFWNLGAIGLALAVLILHYLIDLLKIYRGVNHPIRWFIIDQGLHLFSLGFLAALWVYPDTSWVGLFQGSNFWIVTTGIVFLSFGVSIIMAQLMHPWSKSLEKGDDHSLTNAGRYIGILERLLVLIFILVGQWEGVGFLIATKSVFRFGDLKESQDRKLTEYILIGTFLSFGFAIVTGIICDFLIQIK